VSNVSNRRATSLDLRDEILRRAQEGELTPDEAEAEARKAGVGPLAKQAPVADFDPMAEVFWTLAMALAWGIWRDPAKVREYWNDYRRQGWDWMPPDSGLYKGWSLHRPRYVSLHDVWRDDAARSDVAKPRATQMQDELWKALSSGQITATGIPVDGEARVSIPAYEWIDLSPLDWVSGHEEGVFSHSGDAVRYEAVRIARKDIMALWPAPPPKAKAGSDCRAFLVEKFSASPSIRRQTNEQLWEEVRVKFPSLYKRQFFRAKESAIEETKAYAWGAAGAPGKSNRSTN
jgi:hypothetical protein